MNIHAHPHTHPMSVEAFLDTCQDLPGKQEFVRGRIVEMMTNVTFAHAQRTSSLCTWFQNNLNPGTEAISSDFGVRTGDSIRYPDVVVMAPVEGTVLAIDDPLLVAEVLSVGTKAIDFGEKRDEYQNLSSLLHYLILDQSEPLVWLWSRDGQGWGAMTVYEGREAVVPLDELGLALPLADVYPAS